MARPCSCGWNPGSSPPGRGGATGPPKGSQARTIANIWWPTFAMACAVYAIVAGLIMWAILRGRRTEEGKQSRLNDSAFIVVGGVAIPLVILMVLAGLTVHGTNVVLR